MTTASETEPVPVPPTFSSIPKVGRLLARKLKITVKDGQTHAAVLKDYIEEEEVDHDWIITDLNEGYNGSELVAAVAESLQYTEDALMKKIWLTLKILYKLDSDNLPLLSLLNWKVSNTEKVKTRRYMEEQCPNLIKDGENEAMITIMAVGRKNGIENLLSLLYDVFTKYRADNRRKQKSGSDSYIPKTAKQFCDETILGQLSVNVKKDIATAMNSYEHRLIPGFKFQAPRIYADKCEAFINYTIMIAQAINNFIDTPEMLMPFQVDLMIIPRKMVKAADSMYDIDVQNDPSDDDDDPSEDEETKKDENVDDLNGAEELNGLFERVLNQKYNQQYIKQDIPTDFQKFPRIVSQLIAKHTFGKKCRRLSIVIDRRTTPNKIYIFTVPEGMDTFPDDFCITTLVHMCSTIVIPIWNKNIEKAEKFPFVGGAYAPGKFFQVSFQLATDDQTRLQWNFNGNGIRLSPEVMVNVWPMVFFGSELPKVYTKEYVAKQMNFSDPSFDKWSEQFMEENML